MIEDIGLTSGPNDPQQTEILAGAGGVVIEKAYITKSGIDYDVQNFMVSCVLYEDIFANFMTGQATLVDAASLITTINPYGGEYFTISFRTRQSSSKITKSFNIVSIKDRGPTNTDREQAYTLYFTSGENVVNNNISLSKKFKGRTDILADKIFKEYLSHPRTISGDTQGGKTPLVITGGPHISSTAFIPAFWSPAKCLNWLASFAVGSKGKAPNYLFFETSQNFFFASIEDLITIQRDSNNIFASYVYSPSKHVIQDPSEFTYQFPEIAKGYSIIRSIGAFDMFDTIEGQDRGLYGSTLQTFDLLFKEQRRFSYDHGTGYSKFNHMQDYKISGNQVSKSTGKNTKPFGSGLFNGTESKRMFRVKQYETFPEVKDVQYQSTLSQRNSLLSQISQLKIVIEVPGRSDVEVGKLVNFLYPKMKTSNKFEVDPYVSGLYMITAVKHGITRDDYSMTLELTKDSMMEPLR